MELFIWCGGYRGQGGSARPDRDTPEPGAATRDPGADREDRHHLPASHVNGSEIASTPNGDEIASPVNGTQIASPPNGSEIASGAVRVATRCKVWREHSHPLIEYRARESVTTVTSSHPAPAPYHHNTMNTVRSSREAGSSGRDAVRNHAKSCQYGPKCLVYCNWVANAATGLQQMVARGSSVDGGWMACMTIGVSICLTLCVSLTGEVFPRDFPAGLYVAGVSMYP